MVVAVTSLLSSLRTCTAAAHARLDDGLARASGLGAARYPAFLRASLAVLAPLEPALARWLPAVAAPSRVAALRVDLAALGADASVVPVEVPALDSLAAAHGAAYVVEGSALGGAVLAERVAAAHGPAAPTSYLRLRGRATAQHWRAFLVGLARAEHGFDAGDREAACEAARALFAAYEAAFGDHEVIVP